MHLRNSWTRSTSSCAILHEPSGASGGRGLNFLIFFFASKFHDTSVTRSRIGGNAFMGSTMMGLSTRNSDIRVMHISRGMAFISAEQEPHLAALEFHRS